MATETFLRFSLVVYVTQSCHKVSFLILVPICATMVVYAHLGITVRLASVLGTQSIVTTTTHALVTCVSTRRGVAIRLFSMRCAMMETFVPLRITVDPMANVFPGRLCLAKTEIRVLLIPVTR